jgi:NitT/TauT family transport system substrate-binding protein
MHDSNRRFFLKAAAAESMLLGVAGAGIVLPTTALAQMSEMKWANLTPGFTILVTEYITAKGLDRKHGINLGKPTSYTSVSTYYNDFIAGNYDVCIGSWDTFAARYLAGVPLKFICAITTANMINIIVPGGGATSIKALEGKTLAAPQSTGTYRMMRAIIKELTGIDIERSMRVQNVDNPAAAVTLVMANRADAGLSWEPNISTGLAKVPDMRVLYSAGDEYRKKVGLDLPYFGVAIRKDAALRDPGLAGRLDKVFGDCIAGILGNVDEAVNIAGAGSGIPPQILKTAITSGRLQFKHVSMGDDNGRQATKTAADFLVRNGLLPRALDNDFFAA